MSLTKPEKGEACNGCGICCKAIPCPIANEILMQFDGTCRALEFNNGRYWCGLVNGNAHLYVKGIENKPWAGEYLGKMLKASGGWQGICDSDD